MKSVERRARIKPLVVFRLQVTVLGSNPRRVVGYIEVNCFRKRMRLQAQAAELWLADFGLVAMNILFTII